MSKGDVDLNPLCCIPRLDEVEISKSSYSPGAVICIHCAKAVYNERSAICKAIALAVLKHVPCLLIPVTIFIRATINSHHSAISIAKFDEIETVFKYCPDTICLIIGVEMDVYLRLIDEIRPTALPQKRDAFRVRPPVRVEIFLILVMVYLIKAYQLDFVGVNADDIILTELGVELRHPVRRCRGLIVGFTCEMERIDLVNVVAGYISISRGKRSDRPELAVGDLVIILQIRVVLGHKMACHFGKAR